MFDLTIDKIRALSLVYGDAFYILDSKKFNNNFIELSNAFKTIYPNFNIAYSYKTNYTPKLCKIVNKNGGYAEVVSEMELEIALRIGVVANKIIWNGPIKNKEKIKQLLLMGGTVNIDSIFEIDTVKEIAKENPNHCLNIGLRCNFDVGDGVVSRFGFDIDGVEFDKALDFVCRTKNIHLINLQCHFAKRDVEYWPARARGMALLSMRAKEKLGYLPDRIDIGGGLYGFMDDALKAQFKNTIPTYVDYAKAAATVFAEYFPNNETELLIEPGSALVGDCMYFVGKIETIKTVRNKTFATMLGSQKNISMSGVNPPMSLVRLGIDRKYYSNVDIVGYTCIEGDVLYQNYEGDLSVGDYVVFSNCGSYSLVMKPPFILPNFPVIDISENDVELIKRQEYFDDLFHTFSF